MFAATLLWGMFLFMVLAPVVERLLFTKRRRQWDPERPTMPRRR